MHTTVHVAQETAVSQEEKEKKDKFLKDWTCSQMEMSVTSGSLDNSAPHHPFGVKHKLLPATTAMSLELLSTDYLPCPTPITGHQQPPATTSNC